ncbi:MAG: M20/M25/M40 family metallo-hydrolase [Acidobacteria bacterium]|nr:M20/M25/M40 family metallo-hydrolase [Acidobacteriota bacterium]TDI53930.1 MAG: M20/M25/M40 family metallo-hydrolase [Acidobacteriota bacterium]
MKPTTAQAAALVASSRHRKERGWEVLRDFAALLELPNVTGSTDDLNRNADELVRRFEARGASVEIVELPGASPVVIGELRTAAPTATLGVYVHYDGQPVDPANWTSSPFSATLVSGQWHQGGVELDFPGPGVEIDAEWRIYARGASDDKTPFAAMAAALDALKEDGIERSVDLVFLFEGEEESGSPNLGRYMKHLASRLTADAWLLCDGPVHQTRVPQVVFGVRGYCGFELTFYGPERELHSGHYGNWVPNPAMELASFIAGCKDESGTVTIDGFYDDTEPVTAADRAAIDALPPVEDRLQAELGFGGPEAKDARYADRLMLPSFNVRGMSAAAVGENARNVVPAEASVSIDIRLAAGDVPDRMLDLVEARLVTAGYQVLDRAPTTEERRSHRYLAKLTRDAGYRAARIPMNSPLAETLLGACSVASNEEVVALPTFGGSIPLYQFEEILNAPVAILPIANHDNNQHAPDENLRVANLWYGIDLWATLLTTDFTAVR